MRDAACETPWLNVWNRRRKQGESWKDGGHGGREFRERVGQTDIL